MQTQPTTSNDYIDTAAADDVQVREELTLGEWVAYDTGRDLFEEHIHIVPDSEHRELRLYRSAEDVSGPDFHRVMTRIEDVRINSIHDSIGGRRVSGINLHAGDATTFLAGLRLLRSERSPATVSLTYWEDAGRPMFDGNSITEESLYLQYKTKSGRENEVAIHSPYKNEMQQIANFDAIKDC